MNPNRCETCEHKKRPDGGHCYMFQHEPTDVCMQHTGRKPLSCDLAIVTERNNPVEIEGGKTYVRYDEISVRNIPGQRSQKISLYWQGHHLLDTIVDGLRLDSDDDVLVLRGFGGRAEFTI